MIDDNFKSCAIHINLLIKLSIIQDLGFIY